MHGGVTNIKAIWDSMENLKISDNVRKDENAAAKRTTVFAKKRERSRMNNRILVKLTGYEESVAVRTISFRNKSPHRFFIMKDVLAALDNQKYAVVNDIQSFAILRSNVPFAGGDCISVSFFWLSADYENKISGWRETIYVPVEIIKKLVTGECREAKLLSVQDNTNPRLIFRSRKNLRKIAANPIVRKKFAKLLRDHFDWNYPANITFYDDFLPYSFGFHEEKRHGVGLTGAVILHNQEDMGNAVYVIHT